MFARRVSGARPAPPFSASVYPCRRTINSEFCVRLGRSGLSTQQEVVPVLKPVHVGKVTAKHAAIGGRGPLVCIVGDKGSVLQHFLTFYYVKLRSIGTKERPPPSGGMATKSVAPEVGACIAY